MRLFLIFLILGFAFLARAESLDVILQTGDSYLVRGAGAVKAQKSEVVKLNPVGGGVDVLGLKPGTSEIRIGKKIWNIQVLSPAQSQTLVTLRKWAHARLGLKVKVERAKIFLSGKLLRAEDWLGLIKLCRRCAYQAEFEMGPDIEKQIETELEKIFKRRGIALPSMRWNPQSEWFVAKNARITGLQPIASSLGIEISPQEEIVEVAPMVRTQIYVMEVRREMTRQWGVEWPDTFSAQVLPKLKNPLETLMVSAHALEKSGEAKILASPALLCRSGQEAEFLAGGEFPIKVFSKVTSGVVWRKYGILVRVRPKADRFGKMSISIETEVSNIDGSRVVDGIPGLLTNRVMSHFDLKESRTIAISGLIRNEESDSMKGLPGLSKIPVLGALFSSREFRENKTELVILVKPETLNLSADNR